MLFRPLVTLLEPRQLLTATAVLQDGLLSVTGGPAADVISVRPRGATLEVIDSRIVVATFAASTVSRVQLNGLTGNDQLTIDPAVLVPVTLDGGPGDDTLTAIGTRPRTLIDAAGKNAFWAGPSATVKGTGGTNRLASFRNDGDAKLIRSDGKTVRFGLDDLNRQVDDVVKQTKTLATKAKKSAKKAAASAVKAVDDGVMKISDPAVTNTRFTYGNFASKPLFATDNIASPADPHQGYLNDCYLVASLSSVAQFSPQTIRQTITDLGDGTYAVRLFTGRTASYYRVDADLPTRPGGTGSLAYAKLGTNDALWVSLVEKAFATAQGSSYKSLDNGGWMADVYASLGFVAKSALGFASPLSLLTFVAAELARGNPMTYATQDRVSMPELTGNHAYSIDSIVTNAAGAPIGIKLRNPWASGGNDGGGYTTVLGADALSNTAGIVSARKAG